MSKFLMDASVQIEGAILKMFESKVAVPASIVQVIKDGRGGVTFRPLPAEAVTVEQETMLLQGADAIARVNYVWMTPTPPNGRDIKDMDDGVQAMLIRLKDRQGGTLTRAATILPDGSLGLFKTIGGGVLSESPAADDFDYN
jgi:hypothetical protein